MTSFEKIYDAFFSKILEDEWAGWTKEDVYRDCKQMLDAAIPHFKFPRVSLERDETKFLNDLNNEEIQILATYLKCEWLNRSILTWENLRPQYVETDFSVANLIDKLNGRLDREQRTAHELEQTYYRSINGKPFRYRNLAGNPDGD